MIYKWFFQHSKSLISLLGLEETSDIICVACLVYNSQCKIITMLEYTHTHTLLYFWLYIFIFKINHISFETTLYSTQKFFPFLVIFSINFNYLWCWAFKLILLLWSLISILDFHNPSQSYPVIYNTSFLLAIKDTGVHLYFIRKFGNRSKYINNYSTSSKGLMIRILVNMIRLKSLYRNMLLL